mgnify:CR=1 FL=1
MTFQVKLEMFEGPLDLLLHLIREHQLDILDIPIATITEEYLRTLVLMGYYAGPEGTAAVGYLADARGWEARR